MLKLRVIPTLLFRDYGLIKGVAFDSWRHTGSLMQAVSVYNMRDVDEIVFLDISATRENRRPDFALVDEFADECRMPLTVGGGVQSVDDVAQLLNVGADKVALNTALVEHEAVISRISSRFGAQCLVASIDFRRHPDGKYEVFTHSGAKPTGIDPVTLAKRVEQLGAGEILLTSIDRDGTMTGYDIECVRTVSDAVGIPVVASGGAGSYQDMEQVVLKGKASAVAAASIFQFTELTPAGAKSHLKKSGIAVRDKL